MKKEILIIMPSMFIGGAERSLLGLLDEFDYDKCNVNIFLYRHEGEFLQYIPSKINLIQQVDEYTTFDVPISSLLFSKKWKYGMARILSKVAMKMHCFVSKEQSGVWMAMQYISKYLQNYLPVIPGKYDMGISFLGVPDTLVNKVNARVKIAWNHTDYTVLGPNKEYDRYIYSQVDYIVSVSDTCTKQFVSVYPEFKNKAITIENILSTRLIKQQAKEVIQDMTRQGNEIILLSVGRFSDAKNFDNVPSICKMIREYGLNVKWYLIGYGGDEALIRKKINEESMEEHVIILGKKINPYPYIKACDLYVQPSRYEGKAVTVREAQVLGKPVVITEFATSYSQLKNEKDGIIVPMDNEGCAKGIYNLLTNEDKMKSLSKNTCLIDYSNKNEINKLYHFIEDIGGNKSD